MSICFESLNNCSMISSSNKNLRIIWKPPSYPHYSIEENKATHKRGPLYIKCNFIFPLYTLPPFPWITIECYQLTKITSKQKIILLHITNKLIVTTNKSTLIISHSHITDLGIDLPFLIDLSTMLQRDIIAYDYTGYGSSEGNPNQYESYSDIDHVMDFCSINLNVKVNKIILIGIDAGAIPSLYIASKGDYCSIRGMILLSPFFLDEEKMRKMMTSNGLQCDGQVDLFTIVTEVLCSVMLIHGKKDEIPYDQSKELMKYFKYCTVWFPSKGNYHNLTSDYRSDFYGKIRKFIDDLEISDNKRIVQFNKYEESTETPFSFQAILQN